MNPYPFAHPFNKYLGAGHGAKCRGRHRGGKRGPGGIFPVVRSWGIEGAGQGVGREAGYRPGPTPVPYRTVPYHSGAGGSGEGKVLKTDPGVRLGSIRTWSSARRRSFQRSDWQKRCLLLKQRSPAGHFHTGPQRLTSQEGNLLRVPRNPALALPGERVTERSSPPPPPRDRG